MTIIQRIPRSLVRKSLSPSMPRGNRQRRLQQPIAAVSRSEAMHVEEGDNFVRTRTRPNYRERRKSGKTSMPDRNGPNKWINGPNNVGTVSHSVTSTVPSILPPKAETRLLNYRIPDETMKRALASRRKVFWSHRLYHGPSREAVQVHYCKDISHSERVAQRLLGEKILGFDLEWKPLFQSGAHYGSFKEAVSLIQLASETEIGLFHIAMHSGNTPSDVIAPSLKEILESPKITKTGVNIVSADGRRLKAYLGLEPRALFELSHLHGIVKDYPNLPNPVSRVLVGLANQVEWHLLLPLSKGKVRKSDWSEEALSPEQIHYAASDAYAGYMLYRVMDQKRLMLDPVPDLPPHSNLQKYTVITPVDVDVADSPFQPLHVSGMSSEVATTELPEYAVVETDSVSEKTAAVPIRNPTTFTMNRASERDTPIESPDMFYGMKDRTKELLHRLLARRAEIASVNNVPREAILSMDNVLKLANRRPHTQSYLHGVLSSSTRSGFDWEWLSIIMTFNREIEIQGVPDWELLSEIDQGADTTRSTAKPVTRPSKPVKSLPRKPFEPSPSALESSPSAPEDSDLTMEEKRLRNALLSLNIQLSLKLNVDKKEITSFATLARLARFVPQTVEELSLLKGAASFAKVAEQCEVDILAFLKQHSRSGGTGSREEQLPSIVTRKAPEAIEVIDLTGE